MGFSASTDPTFMIGTGTWSGSICSDNITPLHLINIKRIAYAAMRARYTVVVPPFTAALSWAKVGTT